VTQARVVRSEWTKLHSLRSSRVTLLVAVGLVVALGPLIALMSVTNWTAYDEAHKAGFNAAERSLSGIYLAQLAFGVLGVLAISGEYSTGMIRATLAAVPRRLPVLWAKLAVFGAVTLVLGTIAALIAFTGGQAIFATKDVDASLSDPGVLRAVLGAGLFVAAMGTFGLGLGALLRNSAAAIATLTGLLFVVPVIVDVLPTRLSQAIGPYLPGAAGTSIILTSTGDGRLAPWTGFGVLCAWAAVTVGLAAVMLVRRDV
jgi:ABC-2 type transport system permease protein